MKPLIEVNLNELKDGGMGREEDSHVQLSHATFTCQRSMETTATNSHAPYSPQKHTPRYSKDTFRSVKGEPATRHCSLRTMKDDDFFLGLRRGVNGCLGKQVNVQAATRIMCVMGEGREMLGKRVLFVGVEIA